ncbi:LRRC7 protein, partial [Alectura lathami]|nr:LRRC7 protein [Alectura lathami]
VPCLEMTTKRKIIGRLVPCRCFRGEEEIVSVLDYSHCGLQQVPKEVFSFERTLEELYLDANQIEELPKVIRVPPKYVWQCCAPKRAPRPGWVGPGQPDLGEGIQDFPENIKCCKCLTIIEASVNPVSK